MKFEPKGIIVPVVTPFTAEEELNLRGYRQIVEHLLESGVHGIFPFGTTGEFYGVTDKEYLQLLEATVEQVNGRVGVYAGTYSITTRGVIAQIKLCEKVAGIDAVSVLTPMFISQTQEELYQHYRSIAESTSMPIVLYNNKPKTNVTIAPETVARLAEIPNIIAIKDSTGDMTNTSEYIRLTRGNPNFHVLMGRDTLILAGLCYGASGAIAACANVAPKQVVSVYERYVSGDMPGALDAQLALNPLRIAFGMGTFPAVIKEGLVQQGYYAGKCLKPIAELSPAEKDSLHTILQKMKLL